MTTTFTFTCITGVRNSIHITQHAAESPVGALREHIGALPYDDGTGPFDDELNWLHSVSGEESDVTLIPVTQARNTWLWLDGARHEPQYLTSCRPTFVRNTLLPNKATCRRVQIIGRLVRSILRVTHLSRPCGKTERAHLTVSPP